MPNSENGPKGSFQVENIDEAVAEALRSVERIRAGGNVAEHEIPEQVLVEEESSLEVEVELPAAGSEELEAVRAELREKELLLEESMRRGKDAVDRLRETNERMMRLAADLENYKKRAQREKEEALKFGVEKLLSEMIPVLDNFDRALDHAAAGADVESFAQGVAMTRRVFEDTLGKFGVKSFSAVGQPFDPRFHEAIQQVPSDEHATNVVVAEIVRGWLLHERLVRPAMVTVSAGPGPAETRRSDDSGTEA